ncbi:MAG: hypothetical protein GX589_01230 [Deltaproteobacteria bacterium]|nr:hypothetical protein [Deltaproteobacteria bacterium]
MSDPSPQQRARWQEKAAKKGAIVPEYFEVFPTRVIIVCGNCHTRFVRNLVPNLNEPTFVCPTDSCRQKNWVPVRFTKDRHP